MQMALLVAHVKRAFASTCNAGAVALSRRTDEGFGFSRRLFARAL